MKRQTLISCVYRMTMETIRPRPSVFTISPGKVSGCATGGVLLLFIYFYYYLYRYVCFAYMNVCASRVCLVLAKSRRLPVLALLGLELQSVASHHVGPLEEQLMLLTIE